MQNSKKPKNYPAHTGGGLWNQQKTNSGQPDMKGSIEITQHQMQQLVQMGKMGQEPTLQIAAWSKQAQSGNSYLSIDADVYVKDAVGSSASPEMSAPAYTPPPSAPQAAPQATAQTPPPAPAMAPPTFPDFDTDVNF